MKKQTLISTLVGMILFILACGSGSPTAPPASTPPEITLVITGTSASEITTEVINQPNCNGTAEVENLIERSQAIEHVMEATGEVSVNANGQVGFAGTDVELGATVAAQLGKSYGTTETIAKSIVVKASPGSNMVHTIKQTEVWKIGNAKIVIGKEETTVPFRFRYDYSVELVSSNDEGCNGQTEATPNVPSAPVEVTPTPQVSITVTSNQVLKSIPVGITKNSSNYDGKVILTLEKIEVMGNNRMRWHLSFFNQTDQFVSMEFGDGDRYSYLVDEMGTRYLILTQEPANYIASNAPAGTKIDGWIEFDLPTNGAKSFKLFLELWTFGYQQLRYETPLEVTLSDPLSP